MIFVFTLFQPQNGLLSSPHSANCVHSILALTHFHPNVSGALQGFHSRTPNNISSSTNADISVIRDICLNSDASQTIEEVSEGGESTDDESLVSISSNENAPKNTIFWITITQIKNHEL